jgi:hypothetical protein
VERRCLNWTRAAPALAALLILLTVAGTGRAGAQLAKTDPPKPLPENIVKAWRQAGAEVGWMRETFTHIEFVGENEGKPGDLPAFRFADWQEGRLAKLPVPAVAFGLDLYFTHVTDAGLKELAGLKSLHALELGQTDVTDAGLCNTCSLITPG